MRDTGIRTAWVALAVLAGGCTALLGGDESYHLGCTPGPSRCVGNTPQICVDGVWQAQTPCSGQTCMGGVCAGECAASDVQCANNTPQSCVDGIWQAQTPCSGQTCIGGICAGECAASDVQCANNTPQSCGTDGHWQGQTACSGQTCIGGVCAGECAPSDVQCANNTPQSCGTDAHWLNGTPCGTQSEVCLAGACVVPPSCAGLANTCGPSGNENCCAITAVPGGTYNRSNDSMAQATVSDFRLDRFEITVGRFRAFVNAGQGTQANPPLADAGAHPLITGSGWDSGWNGSLLADQATLTSTMGVKCNSSYQTWTDMPGMNENLPMNCITWYEAFAFCAWDGGRLPTEAEWNYAAAGGMEQREYPWSNPPSSMLIDATYAVYNSAPIEKVGVKSPKGDGRWGQADLAGSMWEWNLDWYSSYNTPCNDCANLMTSSGRVIRGGGCGTNAPDLLSSNDRHDGTPSDRFYADGVRCARTP